MILIENFKGNRGESKTVFEQAVGVICRSLQINPAWLMMVMWTESRLNAQAVNKQPGDPEDPLVRSVKRATGLIQFMPDTALSLGTTTKALYLMNAVDQLHYVYKYFKPWTGKIKSYFFVFIL